jgi:rhamnose utilization protein RhaD (predicted bifunctional aldolase and dehydrogenase)/NAD(P)-dependent dehydrogenase (short-subunit alcohol dehydrogenase family)
MTAITGTSELERLVSRSRLLGADRSLVLHGGGNTSTKLIETDRLGNERAVLRIKGSGADLASAGPADFPGLWLDELLPLRSRPAMSDEEMVAYLAGAMVEPASARPSIETLLHAFLPARHVDHVHADAICALANAPDPAAAVRDALGQEVVVVGYLRPGFELACRVAEQAEARAVVLAHHGLVTWGETHEASYAATLELVALADDYLGGAGQEASEGEGLDEGRLVRLRGRLSAARRVVLAVDRSQAAFADRPDAARLAALRSTPDHMLRIGARSSVLGSGPDDGAALDAFTSEQGAPPRIVLVPGVGVVAAGASARAARQRAEIAAHTHASVAATLDRFGGASWLDEREVDAFEHWPLELYKLTLQPPPPELAGTVALVTGAASGIGRAVARDLAARGAHLVLADLDVDGLAETCSGLEEAVAVHGDLSAAEAVERAVAAAVASFGGLDAVVLNAGIASIGPLDVVSEEAWRRSLDVNLTAHFLLTRRALRLLRDQAIGGSLVYVASKNAFAPGAGFGPYSVAKAGLLQLMRVAALEGGRDGIRANAVNPDAVFVGSKLWSDDVRRERAEAHGVPPEELEAFYAARSLLGRAVTGEDVADAVAFLVSDRSRSTTGAVLPVDAGVPAAFPR